VLDVDTYTQVGVNEEGEGLTREILLLWLPFGKARREILAGILKRTVKFLG